MNTDSKLICTHLTNLRQRFDSENRRVAALTREAETFVADTYWADRKTRGLFVTQLIFEAQSKLAEISIVTRDFNSEIEHEPQLIAVCLLFATTATDLLNRCGRILDDVEDIWGQRRPTGGLHDK